MSAKLAFHHGFALYFLAAFWKQRVAGEAQFDEQNYVREISTRVVGCDR